MIASAGAPPSTDKGIRFCRSRDGTRLAYAVHGTGPPLVVASCWLSHLQHDWQSPVWRHFLDDLGRFATVIRYDERGFGMSDWDVADFSLAARLADLESVIDAVGLERFALLGMSGGSAVAMAYAVAHPDAVTRLVLYGTVCGSPVVRDEDGLAEEDAYQSMIRAGWAKEDPIFRRVFTSIFIPDATEDQMRWFDDLQRMSTSPQNAIASRIARQQIDIVDQLPQIQAPTLILQALGDRANSFSNAVEVSSRIPIARLVALDSKNHILLAGEPAWTTFIAELSAFLADDRSTTRTLSQPTSLSSRERQVLELCADGLTNDEIAAALTLSTRTVERHLSNIYGKLGVSGPAARAAAVGRYLRDS